MDPFNYRSASEAEIVARANRLPGKTLGDLGASGLSPLPYVQAKREVGQAVESFFGIPPNPNPEPDFPAAGIELKVVPLIRPTRKTLRVKERTFLSMIDYGSLIKETWETAKVRKKLDLLLVYYEHLENQPRVEFPVLRVIRWTPSGGVEELLRQDWERAQRKVMMGRAHELSESDGLIMGPSTKGVGRGQTRPQPLSDIQAVPRAWALKPAFTQNLFFDAAAHDEEALVETSGLQEMLNRYSRWVGERLGSVAISVGIPSTQAEGKHWKSRVVRAALAESTTEGSVNALDKRGVTVRVPWVNSDYMPYEGISFPAFRHQQLIEEDWEDSLLLSYIGAIA